MRKFIAIIVLVACATGADAQIFIDYPDLYLTKNDRSWNGPDEFDETKAPAEWAERDAVILASMKQIYRGSADNGYYTKIVTKRTRILVQQFDGLRSLDEVHFSSGVDQAAIRVIQPDGAEEEYNMLSESVKSSDGDLKFAVPNLQIGAIIDYYTRTSFQSSEEEESEEFELATEHYPILYYQMDFWLNRRFFICTNMNDGDVEYTYEHFDYKGRPAAKDDDIKTQHLQYEIRKKDVSDEARWTFNALIYPMLRYHHYKGLSRHEGKPFYGRRFEIREENASLDEIAQFAANRTDEIIDVDDVVKRIKQNNKTLFSTKPANWDGDQQRKALELAFYNLRFDHSQNLLTNTVFGSDYSRVRWERRTGYSEVPGDYPNTGAGRYTGAIEWIRICEDWDIPIDLLVSVPRHRGELKNQLIDDHVNVLVRANLKDGETLLLSPMDMYGDLGMMNPYLENTPCVVLGGYEDKDEPWSQSEEVLHESTATENVNRDSKRVILEADKENLLIEGELTFTGHFKVGESYDYLSPMDWALTEGSQMGDDLIVQAEDQDGRLEDLEKERLDWYERNWDRTYEVDEYKNYEIINDGREIGEPLKFMERVVLKDLVHTAGNNLVVDLGKLIGGQVALEEDEYEREVDVNMAFAKTYENVITFVVPDGYKIDGIEGLNMSVSNATGSFISEAKLEGNELKVSASKTYNKANVPSSQWSLMTPWLDAAYDFSKRKVVLRPVGS